MFDKILLTAFLVVFLGLVTVLIANTYGLYQVHGAYDSCMYNLNVLHKRSNWK